MSEQGRTPETWQLHWQPGRGWVVSLGKGRTITFARDLERTARLIVAAQDLLAACEAISTCTKGSTRHVTWHEAMRQVRAAIAKATGAEIERESIALADEPF
jgi:hypothetical protein